jgi:phage terminase large subunit
VVVEANYSDNPWLPAELLAEVQGDLARDPDKFAHVWGGQYAQNSQARIFRNWKVEAFEPPADAIHRFGADWGFAVDPSVLIRCHNDGRTLYVDREVWEIGCEIDKTPALFDQIEGSRNWLIRADSARPETVSYMQRQGFKIIPALKGPGSIEDGIEFLRSFDIVVHPRCVHVIEELSSYSYKTDPHTGDILPLLDDKYNHTIDALRYALEELRRSGWRPPAAAAQPRKPDDYGDADEDEDSWKTA